MPEILNPIERRVLGVLLEKALTQPQYYPMSVNAITTGCNQRSNRDPVMELDEDSVWKTLEVLRAGGLVSRLLPGGTARVERFKHEAKEFFGWEKAQRAVMTELMLRGPQTVGELRGRCNRMYPFDNTESLSAVLDALSHSDPPRVSILPRTPGQAAIRYAHCFYTPEEWAALTESAESTAAAAAPGSVATPGAAADIQQLRDQMTAIQAELADLRAAVADLHRQA